MSVKRKNGVLGLFLPVVALCLTAFLAGCPAPGADGPTVTMSVSAGDESHPVAHGGSFNFDVIGKAARDMPVTFTVTNIGSDWLVLTGSPRVAVTGADFSVGNLPPLGGPFRPGETAGFTATFVSSATDGREKSAVVSIPTEDYDFTFTVKCTARILRTETFTQTVLNWTVPSSGEVEFIARGGGGGGGPANNGAERGGCGGGSGWPAAFTGRLGKNELLNLSVGKGGNGGTPGLPGMGNAGTPSGVFSHALNAWLFMASGGTGGSVISAGTGERGGESNVGRIGGAGGDAPDGEFGDGGRGGDWRPIDEGGPQPGEPGKGGFIRVIFPDFAF